MNRNAGFFHKNFCCTLLFTIVNEITRIMMVARLKLKGIDGKAHQEWSLRLNLISHGKTYQGKKLIGLTV
jgi:hypothetical protein